MESFANHQEQLLAMQRQQQEQLLKHTDLESSFDLDHSFSSQPTSRFTLDSASAQFAASAVCTSTKDLIQPSDEIPMTKPFLTEQSIKQEVNVSTSRSSHTASASSIASVLGMATPTQNVSTAQTASYGASIPSGGSIQKKPQNNGFIPHSSATTVTNCATSSSAALGHTSLVSALAATSVSSHASGTTLPTFSLSNGPVIDSKWCFPLAKV